MKPGFDKANFDHDNDQFRVKTKPLVGRMTAQPSNRFVFCVVVVEFAVNGNPGGGTHDIFGRGCATIKFLYRPFLEFLTKKLDPFRNFCA